MVFIGVLVELDKVLVRFRFRTVSFRIKILGNRIRTVEAGSVPSSKNRQFLRFQFTISWNRNHGFLLKKKKLNQHYFLFFEI